MAEKTSGWRESPDLEGVLNIEVHAAGRDGALVFP